VKTKIALAALLALLALAGTAQAFQWHMRYGQAKHATREFAEQLCHEDRQCTGFGVGQCNRVSNSRYDCTMGAFYQGFYEPGDEVECDIVLHWGVDHAGFVKLKNYGSPNCRQI
jgi:hypothetical protein